MLIDCMLIVVVEIDIDDSISDVLSSRDGEF